MGHDPSSRAPRARRFGRRRSVALALVVAALMMTSVGCSTAPTLTPTPPGTPWGSLQSLLGPDYVESELFLSGAANRYEPVGTWGIDGHWDKAVTEANVPYTTRIVVNRPADPTRFNGTVWVEWLNVTAGFDAAASSLQARDQIVASGAAWVGVSAQTLGAGLLRATQPDRYGPLNHPSDALSYDIYTQTARTVRDHAELFGGAPAQRVLGVGDSQSALRLATYINAWSQHDRAYDGFVVHGRFTTAAPIGDGIIDFIPTRIRDDAAQPVLQLQTEVEVGLSLDSFFPALGKWADVRQPDAGNVHTWEVAGAAHADRYLLDTAGGAFGIDATSVIPVLGCTDPVNDFPFHFVADAAFAALDRWVATGARPTSAPPIETVDGIIQRDADGNAKGGLRLPDIDLPVARYNADNDAWVLCALFGSSIPFTPAQRQARYGSSAAYVAAYTEALDEAIAAGLVTASDRQAALDRAAAVVIVAP